MLELMGLLSVGLATFVGIKVDGVLGEVFVSTVLVLSAGEVTAAGELIAAEETGATNFNSA